MPAPRTRFTLTALEARLTPTSITPPPVAPLPVTRTGAAVPAALDPAFGAGGRVDLAAPDGGGHDVVDVAAGPGGSATVLVRRSLSSYVVRTNADGTPDAAFGSRPTGTGLPPGWAGTGMDSPAAIAPTADGGVVIVGMTRAYLGVSTVPIDLYASGFVNRVAVVRLDAAGREVWSYGGRDGAGAGFAADLGLGVDETATAVTVAPDGDVIVAGESARTGWCPPGPDADCGVWNYTVFRAAAGVLRLNADGTPDAGFSGDGRATFGDESGFRLDATGDAYAGGTGLHVRPSAVALDGSGRVLLAGGASPRDRTGAESPRGGYEAFAARLTAAGELDASFAGDGVANLSAAGADWLAEAVGAAPDGGVLLAVAERSNAFAGEVPTLRVARLTGAGAVDADYGDGGYAALRDDRDFSDVAFVGGEAYVLTSASLPYPMLGLKRPEWRIYPTYSSPPVASTGVSLYRVPASGRGVARADLNLGAGGIAGSGLAFGPAGELVGAAVVSSGFVYGPAGELMADPVGFGGPAGRNFLFRLVPGAAPLPPAAEPPAPVAPPPALPEPPPAPAEPPAAEEVPPPPSPSPVEAGAPEPASVAAPVAPFAGFGGEVVEVLADVTGDGVADRVLAAGPGGGPRVVVLDGATGRVVADFWGLPDESFRGGLRLAAADLDGDGKAEVAVAAGLGGGPRVAVWSGAALAAAGGGAPAGGPLADFFAFEESLRDGATVAAGDLDGDGRAELALGGGPGGGPRVKVYAGADLAAPVADFFAADPGLRGGVALAAADGLLLARAPADGGPVRAFALASGGGVIPADEELFGGVFVG